jgi:ABC-type dipeptide/oligopeptide/nickel transport system permease component
MHTGYFILGLVIWILIALWPARVAASKGHSFFGYFLLSLPFWWITLFIVYFGLDDKNHPKSSSTAE